MGQSNILLNHQLSTEIISLIASSQEYCFLVTPYYKPWPLLNRELEKAASNEKKIIFIFRNGEVKKEFLEDLNKKGFDIHLVENLHTKLYLNEKTTIITSMNLYDASKEKNYEVGYRINSVYESKQIKTEVIEKDILGTKPKLSLPGRYSSSLEALQKEKVNTSTKNIGKALGFCIRCKKNIPIDFNKPYCIDCFKNGIHPGIFSKEHFCHSCGSPYHSTLNKPFCNSCR